VRHRFEFLRYHIDRHRAQIERLMHEPAFPRSDASVGQSLHASD
jgi:hypothetical protein